MKRSEGEYFLMQLEEELVKRRKLGGFDANAPTINLMLEVMVVWFRDFVSGLPRERSK